MRDGREVVIGEADSQQLILRRSRIAVWLVLLGSLTFGTTQLLFHPELRAVALLPLVAQALLALGVLLRLPNRSQDALITAVLCTLLAFAVAVVFGLWVEDVHITAILVIVFAGLTATLVPWGLGAQSIVVGAALLALLFASSLLAAPSYPMVIVFLFALLASLYVAYEQRVTRITESLGEQDRRRTAEALRLLESAVEQADDAVLIMTPEIEFPGPRVLFINPAFTRMSGFSAEETHERPLRALFGPGTDSDTIARVRSALSKREPSIGEGTFHRKDGHPYTAEWHTAPVRNVAGEITHWVTINRDISERKSAETERAQLAERLYAAQQEQAQFSAALAQVGEVMISSLDTPVLLEKLCELTTRLLGCDCSHVFLWRPEEGVYVPRFNHGDIPEQWESLRVLKIPEATIASLVQRLGQEQVAVVDAGDERAGARLFAQHGLTASLCVGLRRGEEVIGFYAAHYRTPGATFTARQAQLAKGIGHLASLALDNARLFEQLERASRIKSDFVATMSHELRTPLNIIMGYQELLLDEAFGTLNTEQREYLSTAQRRARDLLELISATLDVSRLDQHRIPLDLRRIDVGEILSQLTREIAEVTTKEGVDFECLPPEHACELTTDPTKLKIVLKNLVDNAMKFTDAGQVTLAAVPFETGVEFRVTDSGIGIAPDTQSGIFEPFHQLDASPTRRHGGVGLGLYIVRRMVEMLRGAITVDSELGKGSTFRVWVPLEVTISDTPRNADFT